MSSFQYSDNFSGFNDLIDRVEFLEEKTWKDMVGAAKLRPEFAKYTAEDPKTGVTAPPGGLTRLANILFFTALGELHLGIIDSETSKALKRYAVSPTNIAKFFPKLAPDAWKDLFRDKNPRSEEVVEYVKDKKNLAVLIKDTVTNFTKADREYIKDAVPEDLADAVEDVVDDMEKVSAEYDSLAQSLQASKEDPTTLIEIRISDAARANDVGRMFTKHANEEGMDIDGNMIQFSVDPGSPITQLIAKKGIGAIEAAIKASADKISDSRVVIMLPDENFEQSLYGDEAGNSYAENEVEEDEVDDLIMNNDKEAFILTVTDSVKRALKKALNRKGILFNDVEEGLTVAPEDNEFVQRVKNKISNGYTEEEEFRESYTDGYMSDQSSSDKRNKKKEVLSESFKDRYKPKTHWQLEELRRYGL